MSQVKSTTGARGRPKPVGQTLHHEILKLAWEIEMGVDKETLLMRMADLLEIVKNLENTPPS